MLLGVRALWDAVLSFPPSCRPFLGNPEAFPCRPTATFNEIGQMAASSSLPFVGSDRLRKFKAASAKFALDTEHAVVTDFQAPLDEVTRVTLKFGVKPFVDDGNSFWSLRKTPAIAHGARAGRQHTVHEWVEIDDLTRVALVYAMTAIRFCGRAADAHPT
jgi:hypothetical protein